ncbi:MAG: Rieske (2Fe-2S) protein [Pedosphaera sp.]|nr:Rieske (2Fe-2S) protein [Pedosphaera sp.]
MPAMTIYDIGVSKVKIGRAADLAEGQTMKFQFTRKGKPTEGFVARFQGKLVAYENRCRHLPLSLDYADGRFFTRDGQNFVCQTHNAIYEPLTGLCIQGPCEGDSLKRLKFEIIEGEMWLSL